MSLFNRRVFNVHAVCAFVAGLVGFKLKPVAAQQDSPAAISIPFKSLPHCTAIFGNPRAALQVGIRMVEVDAATDCFYAFVHFKPRAQSLPMQMPEVLLDEMLRTREDYARVAQQLRELLVDYRPSLAMMEPRHREQLKHFYESLYAFSKIYLQTCPTSDMSRIVKISRNWFCYTQPVTVLGRLQAPDKT